jgi:hypothetical protein
MKEWVMSQQEAMDPITEIEITSDFNSKRIVTWNNVTADLYLFLFAGLGETERDILVPLPLLHVSWSPYCKD